MEGDGVWRQRYTRPEHRCTKARTCHLAVPTIQSAYHRAVTAHGVHTRGVQPAPPSHTNMGGLYSPPPPISNPTCTVTGMRLHGRKEHVTCCPSRPEVNAGVTVMQSIYPHESMRKATATSTTVQFVYSMVVHTCTQSRADPLSASCCTSLVCPNTAHAQRQPLVPSLLSLPAAGMRTVSSGACRGPASCLAAHACFSQLEQLPANQHAPDLTGACTNLVQLGVPQDATSGVVVDVTVATQHLDGV